MPRGGPGRTPGRSPKSSGRHWGPSSKFGRFRVTETSNFRFFKTKVCVCKKIKVKEMPNYNPRLSPGPCPWFLGPGPWFLGPGPWFPGPGPWFPGPGQARPGEHWGPGTPSPFFFAQKREILHNRPWEATSRPRRILEKCFGGRSGRPRGPGLAWGGFLFFVVFQGDASKIGFPGKIEGGPRGLVNTPRHTTAKTRQ